jgi:hypothetical protein
MRRRARRRNCASIPPIAGEVAAGVNGGTRSTANASTLSFRTRIPGGRGFRWSHPERRSRFGLLRRSALKNPPAYTVDPLTASAKTTSLAGRFQSETERSAVTCAIPGPGEPPTLVNVPPIYQPPATIGSHGARQRAPPPGQTSAGALPVATSSRRSRCPCRPNRGVRVTARCRPCLPNGRRIERTLRDPQVGRRSAAQCQAAQGYAGSESRDEGTRNGPPTSVAGATTCEPAAARRPRRWRRHRLSLLRESRSILPPQVGHAAISDF